MAKNVPKVIATGGEIFAHLSEDGTRVLEYWEDKRQGKIGPAWSQVHLLELDRSFRGIQVVDVVGEQDDFVYRFVGTLEVNIRGRDPTGQSVADGNLSGDSERVIAKYRRIVQDREPILTINIVTTPYGVPVADVSLFLPLSETGEEVDKILVYSEQRSLDDDRAGEMS